MNQKISAVINTLNEEKNIQRAIKSVDWVDEIVVCDMHSEDKTASMAASFGAKVYYHQATGFVEPARNFAIDKAGGSWILLLDADEEVSEQLKDKLREIVEKSECDFVEIPRKNIIFGKWIERSSWWPDYQIRFFKKGAVTWKDEIHSKPETKGVGLKLDEKGELAIIHHHYQTVSQFIERMNRYTSIQAKELVRSGYKFDWRDTYRKPTSEFLSRFFVSSGYEDGLHGLILSLLQAFSELVLYLKVWEKEKFASRSLTIEDLKDASHHNGKQLKYWLNNLSLSKNRTIRLLQKARNKLF